MKLFISSILAQSKHYNSNTYTSEYNRCSTSMLLSESSIVSERVKARYTTSNALVVSADRAYRFRGLQTVNNIPGA